MVPQFSEHRGRIPDAVIYAVKFGKPVMLPATAGCTSIGCPTAGTSRCGTEQVTCTTATIAGGHVETAPRSRVTWKSRSQRLVTHHFEARVIAWRTLQCARTG